MHLAAAAGVPTIGLFGPSDEDLYGPWGPHTMAVRGPRSFAQIKANDPQLNQPVCHMLDLKVETVVAAARALFAMTTPEALAATAAQAELEASARAQAGAAEQAPAEPLEPEAPTAAPVDVEPVEALECEAQPIGIAAVPEFAAAKPPRKRAPRKPAVKKTTDA
jgi:hypothetical protein